MSDKRFRMWVNELDAYVYWQGFKTQFPNRWLGQDGCPVQQYTGMVDSIGNPIYEGDVVDYVEEMDEHGDKYKLKATVKYDNDSAAFCLFISDSVSNMLCDSSIRSIVVRAREVDYAKS